MPDTLKPGLMRKLVLLGMLIAGLCTLLSSGAMVPSAHAQADEECPPSSPEGCPLDSAFVEDCGDGTFRLVCGYGGETGDGTLCLGVSEGPCHDWLQ